MTGVHSPLTVIIYNQNRPLLWVECDARLRSGESEKKALIVLQNIVICDSYTCAYIGDTLHESQHLRSLCIVIWICNKEPHVNKFTKSEMGTRT